ncbi:MAG TPA: glycosyltransferase family 1 protein [Mycobacteriales bacterium]|nr:glycosyltransferase family 1 protein [Mycobacteriales bacterium]
MRIVVDGRALTDASAYRGIGTYVRQIVSGLAVEPDVDVRVLVSDRSVVPDGAGVCIVRRRAPGRFAAMEHDWLLPFDLRRCTGDVVHSPAMDPPRRTPGPWVQTLHDLVPLMSGDLSASSRRWAEHARRLGSAAAVIAVSHWVADSAMELLGLRDDVLHVVPHGVSDVFRPAARVGTASPYVLFVGEYDPRKRHELAFAVIGALAERGLPHRLVVAGRVAPWFETTMNHLVAAAGRPDRIEIRGYVPEAELVALYQQADAVLVTSSAEGFGFPALEAMACGSPVVAFDNSATSEVVAAAGVLVPDADVPAMTQGLYDVLTDHRRRAELSASGLERAGGFTWQASVAAHRYVFEKVAA